MARSHSNLWLSSHDSCLRLHRDIWTLMSKRSNLPSAGHGYVELTEKINDSLAKLSQEIEQLKSDLVKSRYELTQGEHLRRDGLVAELLSQEMQLRNVFSQSSVSEKQKAEERNRLVLLAGDGGPRDVGQARRSKPLKQSDQHGTMVGDPNGGGGGDLKFRQALLEQDEGLGRLHGIVVRQRLLAENIGTEVDAQNEIIDGLGDDLESTNAHLISTTQRVAAVSRTSGVGKYWAVICLLSVVIVVLVCVPS